MAEYLSSVFVLFASRGALTSLWVGVEVDSARYEMKFGRLKKVLVCLLDDTLRVSDLPKWMRKYKLVQSRAARPIARMIRGEIDDLIAGTSTCRVCQQDTGGCGLAGGNCAVIRQCQLPTRKPWLLREAGPRIRDPSPAVTCGHARTQACTKPTAVQCETADHGSTQHRLA
jgi:hypothetical protein